MAKPQPTIPANPTFPARLRFTIITAELNGAELHVVAIPSSPVGNAAHENYAAYAGNQPRGDDVFRLHVSSHLKAAFVPGKDIWLDVSPAT